MLVWLLLCQPGVAAEDSGRHAPAIPFKSASEELSQGSLWRAAFGFGVVVLLGVASIYLLKRLLPQSLGQASVGTNRVKLIEARRLSPKLSVFLLEVDGQSVLIAESSSQVTRIPLQAPPDDDRQHASPGAGS